MLEFSVLGPLRVRRDGHDVPIARPKSRALLALLLARANHSVATDQLIDELWAHDPPATAESAFRVHVSFLRKALREGSDADDESIEATARGYRVCVTTDAVDVLSFEAALRDARAASNAGADRPFRAWSASSPGAAGRPTPTSRSWNRCATKRCGSSSSGSPPSSCSPTRISCSTAPAICDLVARGRRVAIRYESLTERLMLAPLAARARQAELGPRSAACAKRSIRSSASNRARRSVRSRKPSS